MNGAIKHEKSVFSLHWNNERGKRTGRSRLLFTYDPASTTVARSKSQEGGKDVIGGSLTDLVECDNFNKPCCPQYRYIMPDECLKDGTFTVTMWYMLC